MRTTLPLLLLLLAIASASRAHPPKGRGAREGSSEAGRIILRTPSSRQVLIRGGAFRMGSTIPEIATAQALCSLAPLGPKLCTSTVFADEMVAHHVQLADFWIDRTEVTVAAYERCVDAGACGPVPTGDAPWNDVSNHPVTLATWHDANAYCRWVGGRLPSEAEWERAAKGWGNRMYPWGDVYNPKLCNHGVLAADELDGIDGFLELAPVGSFPMGATAEGVLDMAGNVEEWVADWYAPSYPEADVIDPAGPPVGDTRVVRGGHFRAGRAWMRTSLRHHGLPSERWPHRGFRCARDHR